MSDIIRERSPRSRGRVRCDACGRRIPKGEQYGRETIAGYTGEDFHEWARETTGHTPVDDYLFLYAGVDDWTYYLEDLADAAAKCAADDADPTRAWDDEAWAAFTWRMQTSPAFTPTN